MLVVNAKRALVPNGVTHALEHRLRHVEGAHTTLSETETVPKRESNKAQIARDTPRRKRHQQPQRRWKKPKPNSECTISSWTW